MTSVIDICNLALSNKLGSSRITSLTEDSKNARSANLAYPNVRDFVLHSHPWNPSVSRVTLSPMVSTPAHTYDYEYQFPSDALRILDVDTTYDWVSEGRKILTDQGTELKIRYQQRIEDPELFSPLMVECMAIYLAYTICEEVTQSTSKKQSLWQAYRDTLVIAKTMDAQEGSASQFREDDWINSRY